MSTIPEIQAELRQAAAEFNDKITALTRALSQVEAEHPQGKALDYERLARIGSRRPIQGHPAAKLGQLAKCRYLAPLCALAQAAPRGAEAWLLLQRIAAGLELSTLERPVAAALSMDEEELDKLLAQLKQEGLTEAFLLDAMLVRLCCGDQAAKTQELLTELAFWADLPQEEIPFLAKLAGVLARQDGDSYLSLALELAEKGWPGVCYLGPSARILYTDSYQEAERNGLRRVILHDCTFQIDVDTLSRDEPLVFDRCVLHNCTVQLTGTAVAYMVYFLNRAGNVKETKIIFASAALIDSEILNNCEIYVRRNIMFMHSRLQNCLYERHASSDDREKSSVEDFCAFDQTEKRGLEFRLIRD